MKIYTSYWNRVERASVDALIIRISNTVPGYISVPYITLTINLFPDWSIINAYKSGELSYEQFCARYRQDLLRNTSPELILTSIEYMAELYGKDMVILTCYEKDPNTCHRTELARILNTDCYCGEL